ncbi:MAG: outer membrane protein [Pirellulales bacterium]
MSEIRWRLVIGAWGLSLVALVLPWRAALAAAPAALDLGEFAPWDEEPAIQAGYDTIVPIDYQAPISLLPETSSVAHDLSAPAPRRFYATGIVGGSFLVVSADNTPASCLTGGLALGMALERSNGRIRLEAEGRYRGLLEQTYLGFNENFSPRHPNPVGVVQGKNLGGWSVLANVWRDFHWTDHVDLYGGGGIGAAGFQAEFQQIDVTPPAPVQKTSFTGYAWQVGLGAIWNMNDRVAVDASYRIFGVGWTITREDLAYGFLRSEILLSVRIYEPFRGLLR